MKYHKLTPPAPLGTYGVDEPRTAREPIYVREAKYAIDRATMAYPEQIYKTSNAYNFNDWCNNLAAVVAGDMPDWTVTEFDPTDPTTFHPDTLTHLNQPTSQRVSQETDELPSGPVPIIDTVLEPERVSPEWAPMTTVPTAPIGDSAGRDEDQPAAEVLLPWQQEAVTSINNAFQDVLDMPTGAGKTSVFKKVLEGMPSELKKMIYRPEFGFKHVFGGSRAPGKTETPQAHIYQVIKNVLLDPPTSGIKHDSSKLRYDLIPVYPLQLLAEVFTIGAKKYAPRNWEQGMDYSRVTAALMRHLELWRSGETHCPEDGQHHLASVAWCSMALMEFEHRGTGTDDLKRPGAVLDLNLETPHIPPHPKETTNA